jgi:hypothetical protein
MKVTVNCITSEGRRHYTATNRKGETVTATVADCGHGGHLFWQKVLGTWPKAYVH